MKKLLLYLSMLLMAFVCNVMPVNAQVIELLKDIRVGSSGSATYNYMSKANGKIFMMADDGIHGMELWVSDGTEAGTQLLKDIRPGSASSEAGWRNNFATANNKLFFIANDGVHGAELWATDGTQAGTYMVKNIFPGSGGGLGGYGSPDQLYAYNGKVYFAAQDQDPYFDPESHGIELWCSDGTEEGTYMVKDIRPNDPTNYGTSGSTPQRFQEFNGLLYFVAYDGAQGVNGGHGGELWVTDGTEEGTHLVKDIAQEGYSETPMYLTPCGDKMYFRTQTGEFGLELWATDGTEAGTYLVKDIFPGDAAPGLPNPSYPKYLTCLNGTLYFRANSYVQGDEVIGDLWKSDGTEEGTINLSVDEGIHGIVNVKAF
ncbi:MAG: hypothetical protein Q7V19_14870, partial [Bacteroidales bacterium]|nr:hypothetical protein [Bacteroidales bacterium]